MSRSGDFPNTQAAMVSIVCRSLLHVKPLEVVCLLAKQRARCYTLSKPLHHRLRLIIKARLNLLHKLGRQLAIYVYRLDSLKNLLRPRRARNRGTHILIRQNPRHGQRRDIRI
jgi:hypothetical protein